MSQELEKLRKEFNERIDVLLKKETNSLELNKWYHYTCTDKRVILINITKFHPDSLEGFGFNKSGVFGEGNWIDDWYSYLSSFRLATESEIKEALIKEAEKRGFKEGVRVDVSLTGYKGIRTIKNFKEIFYSERHDKLYISTPEKEWDIDCSNPCIYKQGKWAEIVKDEAIKIGGYEVRYNAGNGGTTIDGHNFTKSFWQAAKTISEHSKAKIMVGCSKQFDVSLETINKILSRL